MAKAQMRTTTPEEEGIELLPDAMERLERAIKTAVRHRPVPASSIRKPRGKIATVSTKKPRP